MEAFEKLSKFIETKHPQLAYDAQETFLKNTKPGYFSMTLWYILRGSLTALFLYTMWYVYKEEFVDRGFNFLAIYISVSFCGIFATLDLIKDITSEIGKLRFYYSIKRQHIALGKQIKKEKRQQARKQKMAFVAEG